MATTATAKPTPPKKRKPQRKKLNKRDLVAEVPQAIVSLQGTAKALSISISQVYNLLAARKLRSIRLGRNRGVKPEEIARFVASLPEA